MKLLALLTLFGGLFAQMVKAQQGEKNQYRNFPIVVTIQFHSLAMPFHDIGGSFRNIGIGLGTEVSLNGRHDWVQRFSTIWYGNKAVGKGWLFYTQTAYRPAIGNQGWYAEAGAGIGYYISQKPNAGWKPSAGGWQPLAKTKKGMLTLPMGIGFGYHNPSAQNYYAPFASYQFMPVLGYNKSVPIIPETFLQAGVGLHPTY